jgi:GDP-L-fucose synthase
MKKILLTGATGFIGRNILPLLRKTYDITTPERGELNIVDQSSVDAYLKDKRFDVLLHLAAPNSLRRPDADRPEERFNNIVRSFLNFHRHSGEFEKIIYTGSGAEYDKSRDIATAAEESVGAAIPADPYGFSKYILNAIARGSENIYNIRLFGCFGPGDPPGKFITDAVDSCLRGEAVSVRQDCFFDYLYVEDLAGLISRIISCATRFHDYNAVSGRRVRLSGIAREVCRQTGNVKPVVILKDGMNNEYSASDNRVRSEFSDWKITALEEGIKKQIAWQTADRTRTVK